MSKWFFKMTNFFQRKLQVYYYMRKLLASNPNLGGVILAWSTTEFRIYRTIMIKTKVVLAIHSRVCSASIEITAILVITIDMERIISFLIPCPCGTNHTLVSSDVHIFVGSTDIFHRGYVSDDIKIFKRGSQVICIYDTICVVSASSSPVSWVISEPKEVGSFHEVRLPIWGITTDGLVIIVKTGYSSVDRKCQLQLIKITLTSENLGSLLLSTVKLNFWLSTLVNMKHQCWWRLSLDSHYV